MNKKIYNENDIKVNNNENDKNIKNKEEKKRKSEENTNEKIEIKKRKIDKVNYIIDGEIEDENEIEEIEEIEEKKEIGLTNDNLVTKEKDEKKDEKKENINNINSKEIDIKNETNILIIEKLKIFSENNLKIIQENKIDLNKSSCLVYFPKLSIENNKYQERFHFGSSKIIKVIFRTQIIKQIYEIIENIFNNYEQEDKSIYFQGPQGFVFFLK
jgi:hypothetical protein